VLYISAPVRLVSNQLLVNYIASCAVVPKCSGANILNDIFFIPFVSNRNDDIIEIHVALASHGEGMKTILLLGT
jgi:hypothetical protein